MIYMAALGSQSIFPSGNIFIKYAKNIILFPRHFTQMAEEALLSGALVLKEVLNLISKIQKNITASPFSSIILQRADKLFQRFQKSSAE